MHDEDDAWRAIVENYGERPELTSEEAPPEPAPEPPPPPKHELIEDPDERFVPPEPPPLPFVSPDRLVAWAGLFGSPTILLVCLVLGLHLPTLIGYLLVLGFIGGFVYLVMQMPSGPQDPFDDGAVL